MKTIKDQYFDGERPLYESRDLRLERVRIGEGESGLKESRRIEAIDCEFEGKYVIWECEDVDSLNRIGRRFGITAISVCTIA